jgi:hypothetical protein
MADIFDPKQPTKGIANPADLKEIAADVEYHAHLLQVSGRAEDAANFRNWAKELRQKSLNVSPDPITDFDRY